MGGAIKLLVTFISNFLHDRYVFAFVDHDHVLAFSAMTAYLIHDISFSIIYLL